MLSDDGLRAVYNRQLKALAQERAEAAAAAARARARPQPPPTQDAPEDEVGVPHCGEREWCILVSPAVNWF